MLKQRTREYTGPSPHAVAIRGRQKTRIPPEQLIIDSRTKHDQIAESIRRRDEQRNIDLKLYWQLNTDKKIFDNTIRRGVKAQMQSKRIQLEERRQMLRIQLAQEEREYIERAHSMKESIEDKQNRMRLKAKQLKEKREAERLAIVKEKLDQQWQNQCEELRSVLSRRHQDQVCAERQYQLDLAAEIEREKQAEEAMYAELWERDRLAKAAREEMEAQMSMERTATMLETLQVQRKKNAITKEAEKQQIAFEAEQLKDDREKLKTELDKRRQDEFNAKQKYRTSLQKHMDTQKIALNRDEQEQLAIETKILLDIEKETKADQLRDTQKKERRRNEELAYHEYLKKQREIEKDREIEIESAIQKDVDAMNAKKADERRRKREARAVYMQEVLTCRKEQINERQQEREAEKIELQKERDRINKLVEQHIIHQQTQLEYQKNKSRNYARDLISQHNFTNSLKEKRQELDNIEYEKGLQTEQAYESRLREVLDRVDIQQSHPLRSKAMNGSSSNGLIFK